MRTNIDIDDALMKQAMKATGTTTKKAAVEASLRKLIDLHQREKAMTQAMRRQAEERRRAIGEGRYEEWRAAVEKTGTPIEGVDRADQH